MDAFGRQKSQSKRVSVTWGEDQTPDEAIRQWFAAKGTQRGFALREFRLLHLGWGTGYRPKSKNVEDGRTMKFRSALIEGTLAVTDAPALAQAVEAGIGSAKAFGFGLLSLAPMPRD